MWTEDGGRSSGDFFGGSLTRGVLPPMGASSKLMFFDRSLA